MLWLRLPQLLGDLVFSFTLFEFNKSLARKLFTIFFSYYIKSLIAQFVWLVNLICKAEVVLGRNVNGRQHILSYSYLKCLNATISDSTLVINIKFHTSFHIRNLMPIHIEC